MPPASGERAEGKGGKGESRASRPTIPMITGTTALVEGAAMPVGEGGEGGGGRPGRGVPTGRRGGTPPCGGRMDRRREQGAGWGVWRAGCAPGAGGEN